MRINREKIKEILDELKNRDMDSKGAQPELSLGCFYSLNVERTRTICKNCRNYEHTCFYHLKGFEIKDHPFEKHREEIYESLTKNKKS